MHIYNMNYIIKYLHETQYFSKAEVSVYYFTKK